MLGTLIKKIIYNSCINFLIRNICYPFRFFLPDSLRIPPSGILQLKVGSKKKLKIYTNPTSYIAKQLFWDGVDNYEFTPIFKKIINSCNTFIDIGANFGYYSLLASKLNSSIHVHAFEPSPGPLKYLKDNIAINKLHEQITVYELALSDSTGQVNFNIVKNKKFPQFLNLSGEHNAGSKQLANSTSIQVDSTSLDLLHQLKKIQSVDLIKIDVEGAENFVIKGGMMLFKKNKPVIICEILSQENAVFIENKLREIGYEVYFYLNNKLVKMDSIVVEKLKKKDFFFIHPSNNILV